ncbi:MAG TPA: hypothetical protein PK759_02125 [Spirochaetales bacterium]|nr:hypothetical protein [Spirochaetales bacterium]HPS14576.1 hypothetical protein [Spirochaetales bacterium]
MKKFALVAAVLLLSTGFVFAVPASDSFPPTNPVSVNASVAVKAALAGYLTISGMTNETDIVLNTAGETKQVATAQVATNLKNWTLKVTAASAASSGQTGALVTTDGGASYRIPYKFTLVGGTTIGSAFGEQEIAFGGISKSYHTRVTGGSTGETITLSIKYGAEDVANWYAGLLYQDSITVTLAAN